MKQWTIWCEGFAATGQSGTASRLGTACAETFQEACDKVGAKLEQPGLYSSKSRAYWGCRMFDNEADARRSFG